MKIGVLSLQGNFDKHINRLSSFNVETVKVKNKSSLLKCDGLIIPGGESTTMSKMLDFNNLRNSIIELKDTINIMGVCAGMILLSKTTSYNNLKTLNIMDFSVIRNGWGRQIFSFNQTIETSLSKDKFTGTFIRAPKVISHSKSLECLSEIDGTPTLLSDGRHIGCAFHLEYSNDNSIYEYFLNLIRN